MPAVDAEGDNPVSLELEPSLAAFSLAVYSDLQRAAVQRLPESGLPLWPRQMTQAPSVMSNRLGARGEELKLGIVDISRRIQTDPVRRIQTNPDKSRHIQTYPNSPDMSRTELCKQFLREVLTHVNTWEIWVLRQVYEQCVNVNARTLRGSVPLGWEVGKIQGAGVTFRCTAGARWLVSVGEFRKEAIPDLLSGAGADAFGLCVGLGAGAQQV